MSDDTQMSHDSTDDATVEDTQQNSDNEQKSEQVEKGDTVLTGDEKAESDESDESEENGDSEEKEGAPEEYETFTVPEGMTLDEEAIKVFTPLAKEIGLSQEKAQKLVDLYSDQVNRVTESILSELGKVRESWEKQVAEDPELSKKENQSVAKKAVINFEKVIPGFREMLDETGAGSHPVMVAAMLKIGKDFYTEDTFERGTGKSTPSFAKTMYPNSDFKDE